MLVRFSSKASGDITMFGDVAGTLLDRMGHSGTVPSALGADDVAPALDRLRRSLENEEPAPEGEAAADDDDRNGDGDGETPRPVGLRLRAHPLIAMLSAAQLAGCGVTWKAD